MHILLSLPQLTITEFSLMTWLISIAIFICLVGILCLILWIRKLEKKVDDFTKYLIKLDEKNYRLWRAKLKAEKKL